MTERESPIIALELVAKNLTGLNPSSAPDLLACHKDGLIRRLSGDLVKERWKAQIFHDIGESLEVVAACCVSQEEARRSWLRKRDDILRASILKVSTFLLLVTSALSKTSEEEKLVRFGIWNLSDLAPSNSLRDASSIPVTPLFGCRLPESKQWATSPNAHYEFHSASGILSVSSSRGHITYDLSSYTPETQSLMLASGPDLTSSLRLGSHLVAAASSAAISLYNPKYRSLQALYPLPQTLSMKKRKRSEGSGRDSVQLLSYFSRINRLLALRGQTFLAFDVAKSAALASSRRQSSGLLIDSIGRGTLSLDIPKLKMPKDLVLDFGKLEKSIPSSQTWWFDSQQQLDELARAGKVDDFEKLMAQQLSPLRKKAEKNAFRLPHIIEGVDNLKVQYLISKVFRPSQKSHEESNMQRTLETSLEVTFMPPRLFRWLIDNGRLSLKQVEDALLSSRGPMAPLKLRQDAVALALVIHDPSFGLVSDYLKSPGLLSISEVIEAVKVLLAQAILAAEQEPTPSQQTLGKLKNMDIESREVQVGPGTTPNPDNDQLTPSSQLTSSPRTDGLRSSAALNAALERLGADVAPIITSKIRLRLDQPEIVALVQYLRQQLFRGGHTSSFRSQIYRRSPALSKDSPGPKASEGLGSPMSLGAIIKLLSSCVDAIGPLGFLAQSVDMEFMVKLIPDLKAEISLALTGIEEATYLKGVLREIIRFGESVPKTKEGCVIDSSKHVGAGEQKSGTIVTLYSEPAAEQGDVEGIGGLLPLSLRSENTISDLKLCKGGGQIKQRSNRQKMHLQGKNAGIYSFDRLVL